jgi:putative transcriptional regulator
MDPSILSCRKYSKDDHMCRAFTADDTLVDAILHAPNVHDLAVPAVNLFDGEPYEVQAPAEWSDDGVFSPKIIRDAIRAIGRCPAKELFISKLDFLELYDGEHSQLEERFIAIGPIRRGLVLVVYTERSEETVRIISARWATKDERALLPGVHGGAVMKSIPELSRADFERTLRRSQRQRIIRGELQPGDVAALRRFIGLTQAQFAEALGISVHTLRNWEQDRRKPEGAALALLRIAARHPGVVRENVPTAA